jgi:hypothetical protein
VLIGRSVELGENFPFHVERGLTVTFEYLRVTLPQHECDEVV